MSHQADGLKLATRGKVPLYPQIMDTGSVPVLMPLSLRRLGDIVALLLGTLPLPGVLGALPWVVTRGHPRISAAGLQSPSGYLHDPTNDRLDSRDIIPMIDLTIPSDNFPWYRTTRRCLSNLSVKDGDLTLREGY